jgi:hypothetical protein
MRKSQECLLSRRRNCAPIDVKALERLMGSAPRERTIGRH